MGVGSGCAFGWALTLVEEKGLSDNRSEQATPRRREKARQKGEVARSRELSSALAFLAGVVTLSFVAPNWIGQWRLFMSHVLDAATTSEIGVMSPLPTLTLMTAVKTVAPIFLLTWMVALAGSLGQTGLRLSPEALKPNVARFNPASNLQAIFSTAGVSRTLKSLVPLSIILYLVMNVFIRDWAAIQHTSSLSASASVSWIGQHIYEVGWKCGLVFLGWSGFDYFLQHRGFEKKLRMTKEEVRQENKDTGPNPTVRGRIRRMQRQMQRKWMMRDVAKATVVVTNPTHYAVALQYLPETMEAPVVLAKGRDLLAQQIKDVARWNNVPIVENVPLAHALYRSAEVGQAIPVKLYAAIAEILAFVYQAQARAEAVRKAREAAATTASSPKPQDKPGQTEPSSITQETRN